MKVQGDDLEVHSSTGSKTALISKDWQRRALMSPSCIENLY